MDERNGSERSRIDLPVFDDKSDNSEPKVGELSKAVSKVVARLRVTKLKASVRH